MRPTGLKEEVILKFGCWTLGIYKTSGECATAYIQITVLLSSHFWNPYKQIFWAAKARNQAKTELRAEDLPFTFKV